MPEYQDLFLNYHRRILGHHHNFSLLLKQFSTAGINVSNDKDYIKQLKNLSDLYKSGALTKEEFTKAKNKILN